MLKQLEGKLRDEGGYFTFLVGEVVCLSQVSWPKGSGDF